MTAQPLFEVTRGNIVESLHYGSIAVVDSSGKLISSYGDPQAVAFLRSSAKPFQVLPFVERGGVEYFQFTPASCRFPVLRTKAVTCMCKRWKRFKRRSAWRKATFAAAFICLVM